MSKEEIIKKYNLDILQNVINEISDDIGIMIKNKHIKTNHDNINFLLYTVGSSIVTMEEIRILCENGYSDGSLSLARNIFEQYITVAYIESEEDKNERAKILGGYFDDYKVQRSRNIKTYYEMFPGNEKEINTQNRVLKDIKEKYGILNLKNYWWCKANNFKDMYDKVIQQNAEIRDYINFQYILYKRACLSIHASSMGNMIRLGSDNEGINLRPLLQGQEIPLYLSLSSFIVILKYLYLELEEEMNEIESTLSQLCMKYKIACSTK